MCKLAHLNNFVKLLCSVGLSEEKLGFTQEQIIICLRLVFLHEAKEVRAAGLRALRYLITDSSTLEKVLHLKVDYLIARCIDIQQNNEGERTQALRLVRKMITVNPLLFPSSITNSLIAVGNDGHNERDRLSRACVAIICELALKNPVVVAQAGGLSTILKSVTDCQLSRINEALITTILHLLNHPHTRQFVRSDVEFEQILAPYTDFHYKHNPDVEEGQSKEDRETRFMASKMSIVASFRSWSGIINLCKSGSTGIQSLIGLLCIPNMEVRKALLEVLYDIFHLTIPIPSMNFMEALSSVDPSRFQDSWRLSDGFVASEATALLPHRSCSRPDLMHNYLAFVLSAFIKSGLLEGLVEVIASSDDIISIRATILLKELLNMANRILPHSQSLHLHCLPTLVNVAASFDIPHDKRLRASAAVNNMKCFHEKKKVQPKPCSLYLDHILRTSGASHYTRDQHCRLQKDIFIIKDTEDALMTTLKESHILNHKESLDWDWSLIGTILKWPNASLRSNKGEQMHIFVRRLLFFYKPSSNIFCSLELDNPKARQITVVGCQFIEFLMQSEEEGQGFLEDLVRDIVQWLVSYLGPRSDQCMQSSSLLTTLSQYYLLFLGTLSSYPCGVKMLEKCSVFQCLLNLCTVKDQEHLLKLTVTSLNYSRDGLSRVILSKILTAAADSCRLYATKHLRVLLRANVEFFSSWGIELLVTQLHDRSRAVSVEALDILDEACGDKANLHALIEMKPALTHLGDKGLLLLLRFLSIPKGFAYLNDKEFVTYQMEKWQKSYNLRYVDIIEEQLNEALTTYRKPVNGDNYVRRSSQRKPKPHVYLPVHLYGQLVHSKSGCQLLESQNVVYDLSCHVRSPNLDHWDGIKQLKAALWALGNIGSTNWGLNLLLEESVIPDIVALAYHCEVLSIRGTCVYVLGLMSKTKHGCETLKQEGWDSVRHSRSTLWPVVPEEFEAHLKPITLHHTSSVHNGTQTGHPDIGLNGEKVESREFLEKALYRLVDPTSDNPQTLSCHHSFGDHSLLLYRNGNESQDGSNDEIDVSNERTHCSGETEVQSAEQSKDVSDIDCLKIRSQSLNIGAATSHVSSFSESRETLVSSTDCLCPNSITNNQIVLHPQPLTLLKSCSISLVPPGASHTLPRRAQSLRSPSVTPLSSCSLRFRSAHYAYTSPRDALGYATLRRLQHQRIQPSLSHNEALVSPAKDILYADAITMNTGSLDSKLTSKRFLKAMSFASHDKEKLLSPINQSTLQRSSSVRSLVSTSSEDYIGLALPVDINCMFQVRETPYFQKMSSPSSEAFSAKHSSGDSGFTNGLQPARPHFAELVAMSLSDPLKMLSSEDTGLQEHNDNNCLYCAAFCKLGSNSRRSYPELSEETSVAERATPPPANHIDTLTRINLTEESICSDRFSHGSTGSGHSTEIVLDGGKSMSTDTPACRVLHRKEILRLIINLSSSVGTKNHESNLLTIKEKFPCAFDDICLYSEVSHLLAHCTFRLPSRRFIQELFQDVPFVPMYAAAESVLSTSQQRT
ncbi:rapamycin-insensitive companion of mTOR-like isoform X1 [Boleophthalmus pectinirostris]|uniref:rapamycin-insensitive companion of mTOR-like isoform X1 n=1 Tax=Boleophthalmus pectinirostris TaxID=150288 RepID=UPI00242C2402|nr:rapamycin-insensitive companion of mTOR-like isoform X1 [Boleophthalmus pectinirostris]